MDLNSDGDLVSNPEYILECINAWMNIDRNNVYGYSFYYYYVDYTSISSINLAISEIIEKFSLGCSIKNIKRNLDKIVVDLLYKDNTLTMEIST